MKKAELKDGREVIVKDITSRYVKASIDGAPFQPMKRNKIRRFISNRNPALEVLNGLTTKPRQAVSARRK